MRSFASQLIQTYRSNTPGAAAVLVDYLQELGVAWQFPVNRVIESGDCTFHCKWCYSAISFPNTGNLASLYRGYTCTLCTPNPHPRIILVSLTEKVSQEILQAAGKIHELNHDNAHGNPLECIEALVVAIEQASGGS